MPSQRSARVARRRQTRNRPVRTALRTSRTRADRAIAGGNPEEARQAVAVALQTMDRTASKGVIHRNRAARLKSRLSRTLNAAQASE